MGNDQERYGEGGPVQFQGQPAAPHMAEAVHVGQGQGRRAAIHVEVMIPSHHAGDAGADEVDHHYGPAGKLVGRQGLDENGQDTDQAE